MSLKDIVSVSNLRLSRPKYLSVGSCQLRPIGIFPRTACSMLAAKRPNVCQMLYGCLQTPASGVVTLESDLRLQQVLRSNRILDTSLSELEGGDAYANAKNR
jgi:hypothetical protein